MVSKLMLKKKKSKAKKKRLSSNWQVQSPRTAMMFKQLQTVIKRLTPSWQACIPIATLIVMVWGYAAVAQDAPAAEGPTTAELKVALDTLWVAIAAFLVFFMNAGFCMLETVF